MTILLYALTALLPLVAIGAYFQVRHSWREHSHITHSELLEGMRRLDTTKPVASRIEGDPNWVSLKNRRKAVEKALREGSKPKAKRKSLYVLKRKTGTEGGGRR
jgi:hypothetical protein